MPIVSWHAPYKDPTIGDLIIRTANNVEFHVHRRRIADVSLVFADMFTLLDPVDSSSSPETAEKPKEAVDVAESDHLWRMLLPLIHGDAEPAHFLADIRALLDAGKKYQMPCVKNRMAIHLSRFDLIEQHPFAVYALACAEGFLEVARMAARRTLRLPACPPDPAEFALVSGRAIYQLLRYRKDCAAAAKAAFTIKSLKKRNSDAEWLISALPKRNGCGSPSCPSNISVLIETWKTAKMQVHPQWIAYMKRLVKELDVLPCGSVAHSAALLVPFVNTVVDPCTRCGEEVCDELQRFAKKAEARIEEAIDKVSLVLES